MDFSSLFTASMFSTVFDGILAVVPIVMPYAVGLIGLSVAFGLVRKLLRG